VNLFVVIDYQKKVKGTFYKRIEVFKINQLLLPASFENLLKYMVLSDAAIKGYSHVYYDVEEK